jgi:hypothetical protein
MPCKPTSEFDVVSTTLNELHNLHIAVNKHSVMLNA